MISIVVMLILAGVSLNATVGENGILNKARQATYAQSRAVLEEYLNEVYINDSLDEIVTSNADGSEKSNVEKMIEAHPDWFFFDGNNDYVLKNCTYIDSSGNSQNEFIKLRLIKKENLPDEIKKQLVGGDANGNIEAYDNLKDVYGCTSDLQVFYCLDGLDSTIGANYLLSDKYDGTKTVYNSSSELAKAIGKTLGEDPSDLNMQTLRTITELKIDENDNIENLTVLKDLPNLTHLTLTNYRGSLSGIERAYKLTYLYFQNTNNSQEINYQGLRSVKTLKELYFYNPNDNEVSKLCTEMSNSDYTSLKTLGFYGYMNEYYATQPMWRNTSTSDYHANLTTLSSLNLLTTATKQSIVCLYVQNNKLSTLNGLEGFTNVTKMFAMKNNLVNIDAISSMNLLKSLYLNYNLLTNDSLRNLESHSALTELMIQGNQSLTSLESLSKTSGTPGTRLTYLNGSDLTNLEFSSLYWNENTKKAIFTITELKLPTKYAMTYINVSYLRADSSMDDTQLAMLKNNTAITSLNLSGCKALSSAKMVEVLPTLTKLKELNVSNTNLNTLSWINQIKDKTVLRGINIQNTQISDITPLANCTNLGCLVINGSSIKLYDSANSSLNTTITNMINNISAHSYGSWSNTCLGYGGFIPNSSELQNQMKYLTNVSSWSFNALENVNVDLRGWTKLNSIGGYCGAGKIYLPNNIKSFGKDSCATYYLDNPQNDFSINVSFSRQCPVITNNTKNYSLNVSIATLSPSYYSSLFTPYLTSINIYSGSSDGNNIKADGIDYRAATNLSSLTLSSYFIHTFDFGLLPTSKLSSVAITSCKISKVVANSSINIESVNLSNNNISDLNAFKNSNIVTLNLKNNKLSNYITYSDENGKNVTKTTCEFLVENIKNLKNIYLQGNLDITDFSALTNAGFKNDGNNNFTK